MRSKVPCPALLVVVAAFLTFVVLATTSAQTSHYFERGDAPLGVVGQIQTMTRDAMKGYSQPVQIIGPNDSHVAYWDGAAFVDANDSTAKLNMNVGGVYQLKITQIPRNPGAEIFPTVELINRLYPPEGQAENFPVVIDIPDGDLQQAIDGKLVTRVVYLENPDTAMPFRQTATEQPYFDVSPQQDVLQAALQLGRPMAIVRLGSRVPDNALNSQ